MLRPFVKNDSRIRRFLMTLKILGVCFVAAWFFSSTLYRTVPAEYDALGTARRPLVIVNGQTQQLATGDYLSSVGGVTTNATPPAAGDIQTATITSSGLATAGGVKNTAQSVSTGRIAPTLLATNNNWTPAGLDTASVVDAVLTGTSTLSGITAQPTGTEIILRNSSDTYTLTLLNANTNSLVANRFDMLAAFPLQPYQTVTMRYTGSNWIVVGWGGGALGSVTNWTVAGIFLVGQVRAGVTLYSTTGTSDDIAPSDAVIFRYNGASTATFTGFLGGAEGRLLIVQNITTSDVTLANETGSAAGRQLRNTGGVNIVLSGNPTGSAGFASSAFYVYDAASAYWNLVGFVSTKSSLPQLFTSTKTKGTVTLAAGTGTVTVSSGAVCVCSDTTATPLVAGCSVSGTTMTAKGTGTDVISYLCF